LKNRSREEILENILQTIYNNGTKGRSYILRKAEYEKGYKFLEQLVEKGFCRNGPSPINRTFRGEPLRGYWLTEKGTKYLNYLKKQNALIKFNERYRSGKS
jgi:predicted transcriptional regulator